MEEDIMNIFFKIVLCAFATLFSMQVFASNNAGFEFKMVSKQACHIVDGDILYRKVAFKARNSRGRYSGGRR